MWSEHCPGSLPHEMDNGLGRKRKRRGQRSERWTVAEPGHICWVQALCWTRVTVEPCDTVPECREVTRGQSGCNSGHNSGAV